ncbi:MULTISPECIES: LysR family transcriptional regulator [unclassified Halomonas]|uniref:LysR family transcriptional regulator n=1 Tax=unclassified Halomonas TaxID=2609666 RepID=UPI000C9402D1|nr:MULTISPECIES: LysR family transcriptional regulator [unclassified Halomonas]MAR74003.1 LysR family transcriptional regulator [Halomonas sp.]|tara:strand:- start:799 stop:1758 length:960 start_codon:yes stop_codon:yes gene_type:complete
MPSHHDTLVAGLLALVEVARYGSLRAAGEQLNLTSGAVSRRLDALESRLGTKLLHRSTREVSLTLAGRTYLERAVPALRLLDKAADTLQDISDRPRGLIRLSLPVNFGRIHIAPFLPEFLDRHPDIEVDADFDDRFVDIASSGHDLAVRVGVLENSRLVAHPLAADQRMLVASRAYLQRQGVPRHPLDLLHHNCLHYTRFQGIQRWPLRRGDEVHNVPVSGSYRANYGHALVIAAEAGIGILHTSRSIVGASLEAGRLLPVLEDWSLPDISIHALLPGRDPPMRVRALLDHLKDSIPTALATAGATGLDTDTTSPPLLD